MDDSCIFAHDGKNDVKRENKICVYGSGFGKDTEKIENSKNWEYYQMTTAVVWMLWMEMGCVAEVKR